METANIPALRIPLLGAALGDALGAGVEGGRALGRALREDLKSVGRRFFPYSPFGFNPGELTDDTQMAWTALTAIHKAGLPDVMTNTGVKRFVQRVGDAYRAWFGSGPPDVGNATGSALTRRSSNGGWTSWNGGNSAGNGSLMRATAPFVAGYKGADLLKASALDSALTHPDPRCVAACVWYSAALERLAKEAPVEDVRPIFRAASTALVEVPVLAWLEHIETEIGQIWRTFAGRWPDAIALINETVDGASSGKHINCVEMPWSAWPTGFVISSLAQATWAAATGRDAADAIRLSVLHGGYDADTIGAIAGGLAGARFGLSALDHWDATLLDELRFGHRWPSVHNGDSFLALMSASLD